MTRSTNSARRLVVIAGIAIAIAAFTGCAEDPPEPVNDVDFAPPETQTPQPPADEPNDTIELAERCVNEDFGIRIPYPAGWETRSSGMTHRSRRSTSRPCGAVAV